MIRLEIEPRNPIGRGWTTFASSALSAVGLPGGGLDIFKARDIPPSELAPADAGDLVEECSLGTTVALAEWIHVVDLIEQSGGGRRIAELEHYRDVLFLTGVSNGCEDVLGAQGFQISDGH